MIKIIYIIKLYNIWIFVVNKRKQGTPHLFCEKIGENGESMEMYLVFYYLGGYFEI